MSGQFHVCGCENIKSALLHRSEISLQYKQACSLSPTITDL